MMVFVVGTLSLVIFLTWASIQTARLLDRIPADVNLLLLPAENGLRVLLIVVSVGLGIYSGLPPQALGWQILSPFNDITLSAVLGLVVALVLPGITLFAIRAFGPKIYNPRLVIGIVPRSTREWVLVPIALVPAVLLEELLFRSFLIGGFGVLAPAVLLTVLSSILFGASHAAQGPLGIIVAIGLGLLLSLLFLVSSSVVAPLTAHYAINLAQLVWAARDKSFWETFRRLSSPNADSGSDL